MRYKVFGKVFEVVLEGEIWRTYLIAQEGKKRPMTDIVIPRSLSEGEIHQYLEDLFHEQEAFQQEKIRPGHSKTE